MLATDIDGVIRILDGIVADCRLRSDPLGYFAALYRQVTVKVKQAIATGVFVDGPRMDRFDAAFANRYLAAYGAFRAGGTPSKCWVVAFASGASPDVVILQQLLLGMSAHINFDLGIAAAEMFPAVTLQAFRADFQAITGIIGALVPQMEAAVGEHSPLLATLAQVGGSTVSEALDFSIGAAREDAWLHATLLASLPTGARGPAARALDDKTAFLDRLIVRPIGPAAAAVALIRETEDHDVAAVIDTLLTVG